MIIAVKKLSSVFLVTDNVLTSNTTNKEIACIFVTVCIFACPTYDNITYLCIYILKGEIRHINGTLILLLQSTKVHHVTSLMTSQRGWL